MIPGFVWLGVLAVLFQLLVVVVIYGYARYRRPVERPAERQRADRAVGGGIVLVGLGQLAGLGATGILRVAPLLSLSEAILVQNASLVVALVGYLAVGTGFVVHARATE